jgi:hypothetical protein
MATSPSRRLRRPGARWRETFFTLGRVLHNLSYVIFLFEARAAGLQLTANRSEAKRMIAGPNIQGSFYSVHASRLSGL